MYARLRYALLVVQANGQAAFFVALFRKETRDVMMQWVQWALPTSIPGITLNHTPAHFLHSFVTNRIQNFQDGVDRRAAAQGADPRYSSINVMKLLCDVVPSPEHLQLVLLHFCHNVPQL